MRDMDVPVSYYGNPYAQQQDGGLQFYDARDR